MADEDFCDILIRFRYFIYSRLKFCEHFFRKLLIYAKFFFKDCHFNPGIPYLSKISHSELNTYIFQQKGLLRL